ncbi:MAG: hypothetical protein A2X61_04965 [Ignavibacteria bacterium GWB2_35_12]|nr:MAG: hypothetical protein A2X63_11105 [Ignavibacteria bacterium GWA2_35_8]OGU41295.1 MAG: hypothetical protein A2X61_04965 [Ignavibacteria bacterium GWB2_35_12]OGU94603.1 MAG: hypothetical protein A2220_04135 [Ignavibacteria bacterium RIFOXYA2_FULL_35_10]OGV23940.1 MAG: hypothetical protein A2475_02755 [Ignavibacteria bacterium RIFOXYC2_FULL_35_21]
MKRDDNNHQSKDQLSPKKNYKKQRIKTWIKKIGFIGFLFFLIKGLLWLIIPWVIANFFF